MSAPSLTPAAATRQPVHGVRRVFRSRAVLAAVGIFVVVAAVAAIGPALTTLPIDSVQLSLRNKPPLTPSVEGPLHLLGTDFLGRDVLARMLVGLRISLLIGLSAILLGSLIGVSAGVVAGFYGSGWDAVIMRAVDVQLSFPTILIAIAWVAFIGPSLVSIVVIIALTGWVEYARVTRGSTLSLREQAFVEGAFAVGLVPAAIMWRHILPNVLSPVIIVATLQLGRAIILESTLSFLGLGIQPPMPSLGSMLADGRRYLDTAWWVATMPGLAIMFLVLSTNLLGDALRDALDPRHTLRDGSG